MSAGSVSGSGAESNAIAGTVCAAAVEPMAAMAAASKARFMSSPPRCRYLAGIELQNVEAGIAIDDVHEPAFIDVDVGDVENPQAAVRPAPAALELLGAVRMVLFIDRHGDAAAVDSLRHRHEGMRRLGKWRVIVVFAERARSSDVGDVDDAQARVPASGPELVAEAQRM